MSKFIYLIGSLRNPEVPKVAKILRDAGHDVFDDWYAAGPEADDHWMQYEKDRGSDFARALDGYAARHVYEYDKSHLDRCGVGVLLMPAGKSGHLELGYMIGQGKPGYILLPSEPERYDVMYNFARGVYSNVDSLLKALAGPEYHVDTAFQRTGKDFMGEKLRGGLFGTDYYKDPAEFYHKKMDGGFPRD